MGKESEFLRTSFMALVTGLVLYLLSVGTALAHTDPPNANATGASLILVALRNNGTTIIQGNETVSSCETIQFRAALRPTPDVINPPPFPSLIGPAIEGGTWTITTPDGVPHDITPPGGIGCIGGLENDDGANGRGLDCEGSPDFILSDPIFYNVADGPVSGDGKISASSSWEDGFAHRGADDEFPVNVDTPLTINVAQCSDAFCAPEMCDPQADDGVILGQCVPDTPPDCNDGSACTTDSCNEETDSCDNIDISGQCDDQDACTADSCDPATGCVNEDISGTCDDSNACTADSCDPATGCVNEDISGTCDDGDACTADSCDPATGCVNEDISGTCDDGDACTADSCDPATGCVNEDISGTCYDGDACTADSCDPATGCVNEDISGTCDDGDACTADSCDPATGCVNEDISGTCDDGDACTADSCDPATGCVNEDISGTCDDGDACTADSCDPATGCVNEDISGTCDDGDACTADSCDPATGCANEDISGTCDDGDVCTADSCDPEIGCLNEPISCDDGDACTADSCSPELGCVNTAITCVDETCQECDSETGDCVDIDPLPGVCEAVCVVIIDEDTIDNDVKTIEAAAASYGEEPDWLVNDNNPVEVGNPWLNWNVHYPGDIVLLPGGQISDEGWYALPENLPWPIEDFLEGTVPQSRLDKIRDVMPLRNTDLYGLIGQTCTAVVYDSDISMNYDPLNGNLQGARYGRFAFTVLGVEVPGSIDESKSDTSLYDLWLKVEEPLDGGEPYLVEPRDQKDDVEIRRARYSSRSGTLVVTGVSDIPLDEMWISVDGSDAGTDVNVDPFILHATMQQAGGRRFRFEFNTGGVNLDGRRITIYTTDGAYNAFVE